METQIPTHAYNSLGGLKLSLMLTYFIELLLRLKSLSDFLGNTNIMNYKSLIHTTRDQIISYVHRSNNMGQNLNVFFSKSVFSSNISRTLSNC